MNKIYYFIASGFLLGNIPYFPGTIGTIIGFPFAILLSKLSTIYSICIVLLLFFLGVFFCKKLNIGDNHCIVYDEIVGYIFSTLFINYTFIAYVKIFFLFRLFDIFKTFSNIFISKEKSNMSFYIMFDDIIAACYTKIFYFILNLYC